MSKTTITTQKSLWRIVDRCKEDKTLRVTVIMCTPWTYIRMKGRLHLVGSVPSFTLDPSGNCSPSCTDQITFHSNAVQTIHEDVIYLRSES